MDNSSFLHNFGIMDLCSALDDKVLFTIFVIVFCLCSPVFLLTLDVAFKKWKKRRSGNFSHSDVFTFNIIAMEVVAVAGSVVVLLSFYVEITETALIVGTAFMNFDSFGQVVFHTLTCVDRYLAVVHPVFYFSLKKQSSVNYRNHFIAFLWALCIGHNVAIYLFNLYMLISSILMPSLSLVVCIYCTIAVLSALVRPKPGDTGRVKCRLDQSKRVAFCTIVLILATLLVRFITEIAFILIHFFEVMGKDSCVLPIMSLWFGLPSSLVLPLLFLHRARAARHRISQ